MLKINLSDREGDEKKSQGEEETLVQPTEEIPAETVSEELVEGLGEEKKKRGIPLILTAHNSWDDMLFLKLTRDIAWDHIIAVSFYIKKNLWV